MLEVHGLQAWYGRSKVLHGVSFTIATGSITAMVGRNGVGKTTTIRAILGQVPRVEGSVLHHGEQVRGRPSHVISRTGIGLVPQGRGIFPTLSVEENLRVVLRRRERWGALQTEVFDLFPDLSDKRGQLGGTLSGGQQEMLAIARAIVAEPTALLLDEPSEGLSPLFVSAVFGAVRRLRDQGVAILLVEQDARRVAEFADEMIVLEKGEVIGTFEGGRIGESIDEIERLIRV